MIESVKEFLKYFLKYLFICKIRNSHRVSSKEENEFLNNTSCNRITQCLDCNFDLELKLDNNNTEFYIISEWENQK